MNDRSCTTVLPVLLAALASAALACAQSSQNGAAERVIPPVNIPQTEAERKAFASDDKSPAAVVNAFNQMAFFDRDPVGAMRKYLSPGFIERSPDFTLDESRSDKEAVIHFFETRGWKKGEDKQDVVYKVIADQDHAVVFHNVTRGTGDRGMAYVDIFRVADGLIVEHWAVGQPVSDKVSARHSMF